MKETLNNFFGTFLDPVLVYIDPFVSRFTQLILSDRAKQGFVKATAFIFLAVGLVGASVLAYAAFYNAYVPSLIHSRPVYFDYAKEAPVAMIEVRPESGLLSYDQPYQVALKLTVPNSEPNFDLGNFMVTVQLLDAAQTPLFTSSRPALIQFQSWIHRWARTLSRLPLLLIDWSVEEQPVHVAMFDQFFLPRSPAIRHARIVISTAKLQVYRAELMFTAELYGLRYLMYYWRMPTAVFFILTFLLWSVFFSAVAWRVASTWWNHRVLQESEEAMEFEGEEGEVEEGTEVEKLKAEAERVKAELGEEGGEHGSSNNEEQVVPAAEDEDKSSFENITHEE